MRLVVLGLSLSSSWGNGHATTFRALLSAFVRRGHEVLFLERDQEWYARHRDLADPDWCRLVLYRSLDELDAFRDAIAAADAVMVGSYVTDGIAVARLVHAVAGGVTAFYDIDTPVTLAALEAGTCDYLSREVVPGFDLYLSFTAGPTLRRLEREFGARRASALHCAVDETRYAPRQAAKRWDLSYLGTYSPDRQPTVERLLVEPARRAPARRFVIAGPLYPAGLALPPNVERIEHLPPEDHAAFYSASRWTLNVTRADMIRAGWSPSVRLFEAGACATAIVSDRWDGLDALFPAGRAVAIADTADDVLAALTLADDACGAIGEEARRLVLGSHTAAHRAAELEAALTATQPA